jgi:hypothetical protein
MLSTLLAPFRLAALLVLVVVGTLAALVVVPAAETIRGIAEEWVLAFRSARAYLRTHAAPSYR